MDEPLQFPSAAWDSDSRLRSEAGKNCCNRLAVHTAIAVPGHSGSLILADAADSPGADLHPDSDSGDVPVPELAPGGSLVAGRHAASGQTLFQAARQIALSPEVLI